MLAKRARCWSRCSSAPWAALKSAIGCKTLRPAKGCSSEIFAMLPQAKLDALVARHAAIETDLAAQPDRQTYVKLSREFSELGPLVDTVKAYRAAIDEIAGLDALLGDATTDTEMRELAAQERPALV